MRLLAACSLGGAGHLEPLLPLLAAARRRGDDVLVIGPPALSDMVERAGYAFVAGDEPPERDVGPIRERLLTAPPAEASRLANAELFARLATNAMLPAMEQTCERWRPDLVLRDPCEYASAVAAGRRGIAAAQAAISLAQVEDGSLRVAASALETYRDHLVDELRAEPYLSRFPASLDPSPFPATVRFHEPEGRHRALPRRWWKDREAPLVYVTFGTVLGHLSVAAEVFRRAAAALADLDARVLLTVGRSFDLAGLGRMPGNVHVEPWWRQADVVAEASLVVCHGGSGTVLGALAAGVPLVTAPMFADQFENGRRVADAGAGLVVVSSEPADAGPRGVMAEHGPARLAAAAEAALASDRLRDEAGRIALEMATTPSADALLDDLRDRPGRQRRGASDGGS